jgi:hypothetical protein
MSSTLQFLRRVIKESVVDQFSIRNDKWNFNTETSTFVTDRSDLGLTPLDPWNRPILANKMIPLRDREGEVYAMQGTTTVAGNSVTLLIFND